MTIFNLIKKSSIQQLRGLLVASASAMLVLCGNVDAQESYPSKPVKILVGSPAGSLSDILARFTALKVSPGLKQSVVVDNRPGANGSITADAVAKSTDGHTLMLVPDTVMVVNQFVYSKLPFNVETDFQSVALLGKVALLLVVNPNSGIKSFDDFARMAKANPKGIKYGSGGPGHPVHLIMELVSNRLGFELTHVPYKGTAPAIQAVASGEVDAMVVGLAEAQPLIKAGRIAAIAASGPGAKELFPELPLFKDRHKDLDVTVWFGIFGPASLPKEHVNLLNAEINKVLQDPEAIKRFGDFGMRPMPGTPASLDALIKSDRAAYGPLVKALGLKSD